MHVCFCSVRFSVLSQEIGWEERLQNDLFCVRWDVNPELSQRWWGDKMGRMDGCKETCIAVPQRSSSGTTGDRKLRRGNQL